MTSTEDRLKDAIVRRFEGMGEAWTTDESGDTLARAAAEVVVRELGLDSDSEPDPRDHGALWHFREASKYASRASFTSANPDTTDLEGIHLINPPLQAHYREMALVHATLFAGLAAALPASTHSSARAAIANLAAMDES